MSDGARLVEDLLGSEVGLAMLDRARQTGTVARAATDLGWAQCLASTAFVGVGEFTSDGEGARLRARSDELRDVAAALVDAGGGVPAGWSRAFDPAVQRWAATGTPAGHDRRRSLPEHRAVQPACDGGGWEAYAQLPRRWVLTDDEFRDAADRRRSGVDEWDDHGLWDADVAPATQVRRWRVLGDPSIVEVDGPEDWDALVARHPGAVHATSGRSLSWPSLSEEHAGVHLTLRGLLTAVRHRPAGGDAPRLWAWGSTGTRWALPFEREELPPDPPLPSVAHDHRGAPYAVVADPRFDEGDEIDGSELDGV